MDLSGGMALWHLIGAGLVGLWTGGVLAMTRLPENALSRSLRGFAICAALWALGDVIASLASDLLSKQIGLAILYSGAIFIPPVWWTLAVRWAEDRGVRLSPDPRFWIRVPIAYAGLMWVAMLTNPLHGAFLLPVLGGRNVFGPMWWAMALPSYLMIFGVLVLEVWVLRRVRAPGTERQAAFMIVASCLTLGANLAWVIDGSTYVNVTLPVLAASGVILTIGMVREGLFGVIPLALPVIVSRDPDGLVVVRPDGGLLFANPRARELLSPVPLSPELPLLGALIPRLLEADGEGVARFEPDWEEQWWQRVLQPGGALYRFGEGGARWLRISAQRVHGSRQRLLAHSLRLHDMTEEQRSETEVRRARRLESVAELALGVAHDFHNLLMVVRGNAELLAEEIPDEPKLQRMLHRIQRSGEQATELADHLKLYAGAGEPKRTPVELSALVRDVFELLDPELLSDPASGPVDLHLELTRDSVIIEADATQLRQVVLNLFVNAQDALSESGGEIRVVTGSSWVAPDRARRLVVGRDECAGEYGYVRVSDTGCGMDVATQERIFEPFFSTKGKHRGIGLSTVFGIVRSHDALLELESGVGEGTVFSVYFPIASSEPMKRGSGAEPSFPSPGLSAPPTTDRAR